MPDRDTSEAVAVAAAEPRGMIALRGDFDDPRFRDAAMRAAGTDFPDRRRILLDGARGLAWMSPDEVLLFVPVDEATATVTAISDALADLHHLVADVTDMRALFRITGPGAREVLAKGAPVDLDPDRFGPGEIRRTRLGQVACAFWMTAGERFELLCFRSVAGHVADWLEMAARPGSLPGHFPPDPPGS